MPIRNRAGIVAALVAAVSIGFAVGIAQAADPKLDHADAALVKAQALIEASEAGVVDDKTQRAFDRHIRRAIDAIVNARQELQAAKDAVDNP